MIWILRHQEVAQQGLGGVVLFEELCHCWLALGLQMLMAGYRLYLSPSAE